MIPPDPAFAAAARRRNLGVATGHDLALLDRAGWRPLAGGRNNAVYAVEERGRRYCLKCYKVDGRRRAEREWQALRLLADRVPVCAPRPLWHDPDAAVPVTAMDFVPGEGLGERRLDRRQLAALADLLARLFALTPAEVAGPLEPVAGPPASILHRTAAGMEPGDDEAAMPADRRMEEARTLWTTWLERDEAALLLEPAPAVFAHGDGNLANCLWDAGAGRLGLVDFEYSGWSDRAVELATWVEHVQSRGTPDGEWAWFVARFGLSAAERRRYEAARRLFALFWVTLLASRAGDGEAADRREQFTRQLARARCLVNQGS